MAYVSGTINLTKADYTTPNIEVGATDERASVGIASDSIGLGGASVSFEWSIDGANFYPFATAIDLSAGSTTEGKESIDIRGIRFVRLRTRVADGAADPSAKFAVNTA